MSPTSLHIPAGSSGTSDEPVSLTPDAAGWDYCGLRVLDIGPASTRAIETGVDEVVLLPLAGSFRVDGETLAGAFSHRLHGRPDVFSGVTDFVYLPPRTSYRVEAEGSGRLAIASARAELGLEPAYGRAEDVPVEIRGAGRATREVHNFMAPGAFGAEKLMAVEVLTPSGNWSSYPPHKHDQERPGEAKLEEIYYFELRTATGEGALGRSDADSPFGLQVVYEEDGERFCGMVESGDVVLVPRGYHGPSAAAPGYDMYYLNVLAGPGSERSMAFCDDPRHAWVRAGWASEEPDPRLPMKGATADSASGAP